MLDALRRGTASILAKVLLGLLVVAFAVWGIGDVIRVGARGALATVGKTQISVEEYRQAYQDELSAISRRLGRRVTADQAKLLGLDNRALSRLVGDTAIDLHARQLDLTMSEAAIADAIRTDGGFRGPDGQFSKDRFKQHLYQSGVSEGYYVAKRRKEEVRDQIVQTLVAGIAAPQSLIDVLHRFRGETRVIEFVTPDFAKLVKVAEPDEGKLREFHEQNKRQFITPEVRKANVLLLTGEDAKARAPVGEEELKAAYEATKATFNIPEKRRIQQLPFSDKAAADKAYAELSRARDFKGAVAKLGFKESDIELGLLTRKAIIDPKVADAAFALKKNEISRPVEGQFATVLVRVGDIEPGRQRPFEEVKAEIAARIAGERAGQEVHALHDKVEAERSAGTPLKEIGDKLKLPLREIAEIDRSGKTAGGKAAIEHAEASRITAAIFSGAPGIEAEAVELGDAGYAWLEVLGVTPERQKSFEEVTAEVKAIYLDVERRKEMAALATKLVERLKGGEAFDSIAKELGVKVQRTGPITRATSPQGLSPPMVQQAFALPKGGVASVATQDGKSRTILRTADIVTAPDPTPEQASRLKLDLTRQLQIDVLDEYVGGLRSRYGFTVNEALMRQALGTREQPDSD